MSKLAEIDLTMKQSVGGQYRAIVRNAFGHVVRDYGDVKNLILPAGVGGGTSTPALAWPDMMVFCHAGTGNTPNSALLSGTFSQTGTTVTRTSGAGVFASGNVNDFIKFATGEIAKITVFTNTTTVTVDRSQTVAAAALTIYDTSRVALDAWVVQTSTLSGSLVVTQDTDTGIATFKRVFDFPFEVAPKVYTELGVSYQSGSTAQLMSRVVPGSSIAVDTGQFLQIEFTLSAALSNYRTSSAMTVSVTGWPRPYSISSITANGSYFDIVLTEPHHYATGRDIIVAGAVPERKNIVGVTSTSLNFTVECTAHGKNIGDSIELEGITPSGYNGPWTVASVGDANHVTVTSGINLGAGTGGTLRYSTPGTWFNGTHNAASFPNSSTIRVTSAINPPPAGASGNVTNSTAASAIITGFAYAFIASGNSGGALDMRSRQGKMFNEASMKTGLSYGVVADINSGGATAGTVTYAYNAGTRTLSYTSTFASAIGNGNVRQLALNSGTDSTGGALVVTFDERQLKEVGWQLALDWKIVWEPVLS